MSRKKKNVERQRQSTRQLIGIDGISEYSLLTGHGELVFFSIRPTNISVLSDSSVAARIYALMTVLKGMLRHTRRSCSERRAADKKSAGL